MKLILPIFILMLVNLACLNSEKKVALFIMPEYGKDFNLTVNDKYSFNSIVKDSGKHGPQEYIGNIFTQSNMIKIKIRILDKDSSFLYNIDKTDSLIFGLDISNQHFVIQNQNEYIWYYD